LFWVEDRLEANFAGCALNGRVGYRINFLRCEAMKIGNVQFSMIMVVLLLLVGFPTKIVIRFG